MSGKDWFPPAVMLKDACPSFFLEVSKLLNDSGAIHLTSQLNNVSIASQALNGGPEGFSFLAYPVPRLTQDQRQSMDLMDPERIDLKIGEAQVRIDLDDFGQINWFSVTNLPQMYSEIRKFMPA